MASQHTPYVSPGGSYYPTQSPPPPSHYMNHAGPSNYPFQYPPHPGRMTPRGTYRPRGGYQNYQQQQYMPLPPNGAAKFSPSYAYPHPAPYSPVPGPSWQNVPQQLSPLPKQLEPAPSNNYANEGITPSSPVPEPTFLDQQPIPLPEPTSLEQQPTTPSSPSLPPAPSTSSSSSPPSSPSISLNSFVVQFAVWSRRPTDPTQAPGLVFSSRSRLPSHIIQKALPDRTPPPSPTLVSVSLEDEKATDADDAEVPFGDDGVRDDVETEEASTSWTALSSEAVTEATETPSTTLPVSPASSSTSIEAAGKDTTLPTQAQTQTQAQAQPQGTSENATKAEESSLPQTQPPQTPPPQTKATPTPAPAPIPPPLKKSWASLLRSPSSTPSTPTAGTSTSNPTASTSTPSSSSGPSAGPSTSTLPPRAKIPVSTVVGISIPADQSQSQTHRYREGEGTKGSLASAAKRNELRRLLGERFDGAASASASVSVSGSGMSFAGAAAAAASATATAASTTTGAAGSAGPVGGVGGTVGTAAAATSPAHTVNDIHPRGLINTGNMCFANSVLQVLLFCPPFFRLFSELGRVAGVGGGSGSSGGGGGTGAGAGAGVGGGVGKEVGVETPLVDATIEFLRDFLPSPGSRSDTDTDPFPSVPSAPSTSNTKGKGKEQPRSTEPEAFIPTYIYDALKEKKRFDSMRGGHQEDAEEFLGFYLDTLEEELLGVVAKLGGGGETGSGGGGSGSGSGGSGSGGKNEKGGKGREEVEEVEEDAPPEEDGWLEVGKRNRTIVTRTIKSTESPITRIFGGKFRSSLRVPGQKESAIVEDWRSLRLDIQRDQIHTIQEALSYISHPQQVHLTNPPREGSQLVQIEDLPPVLILHMKRFHYDAQVGGVVKIAKQIAFGPELVVGSDVLAPSAAGTGTGTGGKRSTKYKLFAAIYHHGVSASGGHYTLDVLHPNRFPGPSSGAGSGAGAGAGTGAKGREGWIRIDDELVSDVRPEDVFDGGEGAYGYGYGDSTRCAYLLFYRRVR